MELSIILLTIIIIICVVILLWILIRNKNYIYLSDPVEHDVLTGTFNRTGFLRYTENKIKKKFDSEKYAILFFNIKGFKAINELFGSTGGDMVLKQCAESLKKSSLNPIFIARVESDHFVCLIEKKYLDFKELSLLCRDTYTNNKTEFSFYKRCGIYYIRDNKIPVYIMCDRAKLAKEYIKDDYTEPFAVYNHSMRDWSLMKKELTSDLELALQNKQIQLFYQPIYNAMTEKCEMAETLVRWNHPVRGMLSPDKFIPAFEENGYVSVLDEYVINQTSEFVCRRKNSNQNIVPISVNLSRMDFYDTGLIESILSENKNKFSDLCDLEITESAYYSITEVNKELLPRIKKFGFKIFLDDFGSGYSSFSSMCNYDFDYIKLDMQFIKKIETSDKTRIIIQSIIDLVHHIGAKVIAEGVETKAQLDFLKECNCDYIQGFYFSKPIPEKEFSAMLDNV